MTICSATKSNEEIEASAQECAEQMTPADLAGLCETRAATYGLLARLYRTEVDEDMLSELTSAHYPVSSDNASMDKGYYSIAKYLSNAWVDPITELSVDFSKAFLGSGIDTYSAAYPYESVYTSEKRLLMQDARDEVLAIYRANGLDKAESWKVGEDHISVELEFMRILNRRTIQALRDEDMDKAFSLINTQRNFLSDHIAVWVPVFTADVRRFASTLFYQGLADLTEGFLEEDLALLNDLVVDDADDAEDASGANGDKATDSAVNIETTDGASNAEVESSVDNARAAAGE